MRRRLSKSIIQLALSAAVSAGIVWAASLPAGASIALPANPGVVHADGTPWD
jgi:hypothetical protein